MVKRKIFVKFKTTLLFFNMEIENFSVLVSKANIFIFIVFKGYYFRLSPTYGNKANCLHLFTAVANLLWYFSEVPVILLGSILP